MNNVEDRTLREQMNAKAKITRPLTDEEKTKLADALKPVAGRTLEEKLDYLNLPRIVPNDPAPFDPIEAWKPDELKNALMQSTTATGDNLWLTLKGLAKSADKETSMLGELLIECFTLNAISMSNPMVADGLAKLKAAEILTEEQYDALHFKPRENWPNTILS